MSACVLNPKFLFPTRPSALLFVENYIICVGMQTLRTCLNIPWCAFLPLLATSYSVPLTISHARLLPVELPDARARTGGMQKLMAAQPPSPPFKLKCRSCGHHSDKYEQFLDLSMELPKGVTTVEGALEAFTSVEHLKGSNRWCCNVCKKMVEADKNLTIFKVRWGGKGRQIPFAVQEY